jgi:hypothetical protein
MIREALASAVCLAALCVGSIGHAAADPQPEPITGPKLLCFGYSTFSLLSGERVTGFSANFDVVSIEVDGPSGTLFVSETDIRKAPKDPGHLVLRRGDVSVYWVDGADPHYDFYGRTSFYRDRDRLLLELSGPSLRGKANEAAIYRRLDVRDPKSVDCQHTFKRMFQ